MSTQRHSGWHDLHAQFPLEPEEPEQPEIQAAPARAGGLLPDTLPALLAEGWFDPFGVQQAVADSSAIPCHIAEAGEQPMSAVPTAGSEQTLTTAATNVNHLHGVPASRLPVVRRRIVEFCCGPNSLMGVHRPPDCEVVRITEDIDAGPRGCG